MPAELINEPAIERAEREAAREAAPAQPYTVQRFVADQLRAAAPDAEWHSMHVDRDLELANILVRAGVRDLSRLELVGVKRIEQVAAWAEPEAVPVFALRYDGGEFFGFMGTPDRRDNTRELQGTAVAWSAVGKGHVTYIIKPAALGGFAIVPLWASSSDWGTFRQAVMMLSVMVVSFALPAAGIAVANTLGAAIIGPTLAASYPGLASVVGNVALSAAFTRGNVEDIAKNAVLMYAGAQAGALVGSATTLATDAPFIGKMAAAGTSALVQGRDVEQAVAVSFLQNAGAAVDYFTTEPISAPAADWSSLDISGNPFPTDPGQAAQVFAPMPISVADYGDGGNVWGLNLQLDYQMPAPNFQPANFSPVQQTAAEPPMTQQAPRQTQMQAQSAITQTRDVINVITSAAMQALQLVRAYQAIDNPQVLTQARATAPNGSTATALDNGTVQVRSPDGRITYTQPPPGVAQSTVGGNIVVNNGDGTYTLIAPNGSQRVIAYGPEATGGGLFGWLDGLGELKTPAIIGGGLLIAAALRGLSVSRKG